MTFGKTVESLGLRIVIKPYRKSWGGNNGRTGKTGKKAVVTKEGEDGRVEIKAPTFKDLCRELRRRFSIPPHIRINEGETSM